MKKRWIAVIMIMICCLCFCGCGETSSNNDINPPVQDGGEDSVQPDEGGESGQDGGSEQADGSSGNEAAADGSGTEAVKVSSVEELIAAIQPDADIVLEQGYYNLTEYLDQVWAEEGAAWNDTHEYIQLVDCFDGVEIVIRNVDNLSISGGGDIFMDTRVVTDPRYAAIMTFEECSGITITDLTMGHTEYTTCSGNVLNFYSCSNVNLERLDLYGCGVYAVAAEYCGDITIKNCFLRDCSDGSLWIIGGEGTTELINCRLIGSDGGGYYEPSENSVLRFVDCEFGEWETTIWYFNENIETVDCIWGEILAYPEY